MKNSLIVIPFNAHLDDVCDYAEQTIRLLAKSNATLGVALGNPLSLYRDFGAIWRGKFFVTQWGARVLRPVMIIPFQRFELIKRMNFFLNIVAINSWLLFRPQPKILWFFEPRYLSLFLRFSIFKLSVFDCVDYFSAYENWHAEQVYCLKKALIVAFNSHTLKRHYQTVRPDTLVVPLGLSVQDMSPILPKKEKRSFLTIGFIGSIGYRIDFKFLNRLFILGGEL